MNEPITITVTVWNIVLFGLCFGFAEGIVSVIFKNRK